jgi:class 3 adenylate cyclase
MAGATTRNLTILLTDIEDFTPKTSRKTRADILRMLEEHKSLVLPVLERKGGRLIKTIGDAFLVVFDSPTDAVLAGVEVQRLLREHNEHKLGDDRLDVRIAINAGEVTLADNDVFGEPVNITARINGIAEAGEVFFTEAVYLAMNKMEVPSSEVGLLQLKGIAEKIRVYKVVREKRVGETSGDAAKALGSDALAASAPASARYGEAISGGDRQAGSGSAAGTGATVTARNAPRRRRVAALLLDAAFCAFFIGALFSTKPPLDIEASVEMDPGPAVAAKDAPESVVPSKDQAIIDDTGVRVGDDVVIGADGVRIGEAVNIDADNFKVDATKFDKQTSDQLGLALAAIAEQRRKMAALESRELVSFSLFWLVYSTFFLTVWSATPGKRLMGVRIVRSDGTPLDWKVSLIRSLFSVISGNFVMLGYIWGFFSKDRRTWHDRIAATQAIRSKE